MTAALLLLSVGSLNLGLNTLFPFTERIGVSIGLTLTEIGRILSFGAVLSILGPIAAGVLGTRGGRTLPLAFGVLSQIAGVLILVYATSHLLWAGSYAVSSMALMYFMPLLYGLGGVLRSHGPDQRNRRVRDGVDFGRGPATRGPVTQCRRRLPADRVADGRVLRSDLRVRLPAGSRGGTRATHPTLILSVSQSSASQFDHRPDTAAFDPGQRPLHRSFGDRVLSAV